MKNTSVLRFSSRDRVAIGLIICCCGFDHSVLDVDGAPGAAYCCSECGRPLVCMGTDGKLYHIGRPVIQERG